MGGLARSMKALLFAWLLSPFNPILTAAQDTPEWPTHDNGLSDVVQWDHYSFKVNGKRLFLFGGELHYWRIPVPELWEDILEKIKASGFTAVAFYNHWGYHSFNPDSLDFETGGRDFTRLYDIAKRVGLYVIVRPGPYVNAETNAGGFPGWLTTGDYGRLRNNDTRYIDAYTPFWEKVAQLSVDSQVTKGGNSLVLQVENEYSSQWIGSPYNKVPNLNAITYMEHLQESAKANGIDIPLIQNAPNMNTKSWSKDFSDARGNVDVYGLDSYPSCWSCNLDECTSTNGAYVPYQVLNYFPHFQEVSPTQPSFMPEFQGGSYNPWDGPEGGCPGDIGEDFANLFYRHVIAERVTAISLYMMYGGTNWGALAAPVVATSYDYSSPISENRKIWEKFYETKNIALFTRIAEDLTVTERLGNSTSYTTNSVVMATELRNADTNGAFYITRHSPSSLGTKDAFKLHVSTSLGDMAIPRGNSSLVLNGHQSKIVVTDFRFGDNFLVYSTAEVLTYAIMDDKATLVLWVPTGESGEFYIQGANRGNIAKSQGSTINFTTDKEGLMASFTQNEGSSVVEINEFQVVILDRTYAHKFWAPSLGNDPFAPVDESILVQGPYLVRGAQGDEDSDVLALTGDINAATTIEVYAPEKYKSFSWNGKPVKANKTKYGSLVGEVAGPSAKINLPDLSTLSWKSQDALPEIAEDYDDSGPAWIVADKTETANPFKPDTVPVLYADEYGFHYNSHLWRGSFVGAAQGAYLAVQGGTAFGWSAFVNGAHVGSWLGGPKNATGNMTIAFTNATLHTEADKPNTLLVVMDNTGHDQREGAINPRGILAARLLAGNSSTAPEFKSWKVAGSAGGADTILDPVRGPLAEGAFAAERLGWHLPGFEPSESWNSTSPSAGFSNAGARFFRTTFPLAVPSGHDVALSLRLSAPAGQKFRAQIFVNGYQYGKFHPWIGNQKDFPVPPGIWDYQGENTLGVLVWSQGDGEEAKLGIELREDFVVESSFESSFESDRLRPGWTVEREKYA